ncbi:MAG: hypothetical protein GFH27_549283n33 [Chloroflexi bacterium AL-W]|nr:hypothetical protein [Chloroflexi bacterium AL-N1]NOK64847.1 hypothetical protein [Chloroflexi bacterium AL-N10]NOK76617.1 hypothetical protein [Chloroflexi bacterium AL-N5]NOK80154.1 hypothetical protein [Chloroflexi bacterium AL-W]NOK86667.1 hypothetical protein [Chloroflexi bacterium AL-N15]
MIVSIFFEICFLIIFIDILVGFGVNVLVDVILYPVDTKYTKTKLNPRIY